MFIVLLFEKFYIGEYNFIIEFFIVNMKLIYYFVLMILDKYRMKIYWKEFFLMLKVIFKVIRILRL